jgi:hypothetical protein
VPPSFWLLCRQFLERRYSSQRESNLSPTRLRTKQNSCEQRPDCASKLRPPLKIRRGSSNSSVDMGSAILVVATREQALYGAEKFLRHRNVPVLLLATYT